MNNKFFCPSFEFERKTKAFNISLWGFAGLISMFALVLVIGIHSFLVYYFGILNSFIEENMSIIALILIIIFVFMFGIGFYKFLKPLLYSYKFEDNKIIKGRIISSKKVKGVDLAFDTIMMDHMAKNFDNTNAFVAENAAMNMNTLIDLIDLNTNQEFVNKFFDTDIYKKRIYNNPRLKKETKYTLIYTCDGNKKIVIPKLYEGMNITQKNDNEKSISSRILFRSLIVLGILLLFIMIDLFVGISNNEKYKANINQTCELMRTNLSGYGYSMTSSCYFEKKVSEPEVKRSTIDYKIDKNGAVTRVSLRLYYNNSNYSEEELRYIISTLNINVSNKEINDFIEKVNSSVNGNYSYGLLRGQFLEISLRDGFIVLS